MLADIVSKNGNLLLNIPVRADGSIDDQEEKILNEIGDWLHINGEAIYATRPWKTYGEGGEMAGTERKYSPKDIRFTRAKDGSTLYAIVLGEPMEPVRITSLAAERITSVSLLGSDAKVDWKQNPDALVIQIPHAWPCKHAVVYKIKVPP